MAALTELRDRPFGIGDLRVPERFVAKDPAAPVDHADEKTLRVLRELFELRDKCVVLCRQQQIIGLPDEAEQLPEMIVIIVNREDGRLHPYRPFHSFLRRRSAFPI